MSVWGIIWSGLVLFGSNLLVGVVLHVSRHHSHFGMESKERSGFSLYAKVWCVFVIIFKSGSAVGHMTLLWFSP